MTGKCEYVPIYSKLREKNTLNTKQTIIQAMWIHVYIAMYMYPHSKDTIILYVLAKMWIHVYIARYPHLEDIQHIPLFVFDAQSI